MSSSSGSGRGTPNRPSMREQIAAKRAEVRKNTPQRPPFRQEDDHGRGASPTPRRATGSGGYTYGPGGGVTPSRSSRGAAVAVAPSIGVVGQEMVEDKNAFSEISKAVSTGKLDISSLSLSKIPHEVYTTLLGISVEDLSSPPIKEPLPTSNASNNSAFTAPGRTKNGMGMGLGWDASELSSAGLTREEEQALIFGPKAIAAKEAKRKLLKEEIWKEPEELTVLKLGFNSLSQVEKEVGMFGGLKSLDLSHNKLTAVPDSFSDLLKLTTLDLSNNTISSLPQSILLLPLLQVLDLSHNELTSLSFDSPIKPSEDGLGYGIGFFTTAFARAEELKAHRPIWPALRSLDLSHNQLTNDTVAELGKNDLKGMRVLNLQHNNLKGQLDVEVLGLGKDKMPQLASLVLSYNSGLQGITGELTRGAKVESVGCNLLQSTSTGTNTFSVPTTLDQDPITPAPGPAPVTTENGNGADGGAGANSTEDIPMPDMTLVYRTLPAATFDSEPLNVDFDLYLPPSSAIASSSSRTGEKEKGHPLIVWFHGGGLLQGNKENLPPHLRRLPRLPIGNATSPGQGQGEEGEGEGEGENVAVISANYRLSPQVPILEILDDITHLMRYIKTRLNNHLVKVGKKENMIDIDRICLSGGSAGGYLALIAGLNVPKDLEDEHVGGYRGLGLSTTKELESGNGIRCLAPFYPITDLTDTFWSTETNPVPWMGRTVTHSEAKPHLDRKAAPICTAVSGGPRSILYPYMLQHSLFPSLLFLNQRSTNGFRPTPSSLSIPNRLNLIKQVENGSYPISLTKRRENNPKTINQPPIYLCYGTSDDKVQPQSPTIKALQELEIDLTVNVKYGKDHAFDEDPSEDCQDFKIWLAKYLL